VDTILPRIPTGTRGLHTHASVYRAFDAQGLGARVLAAAEEAGLVSCAALGLTATELVDTPARLSWLVARSLPVSLRDRLTLLQIPYTALRLRALLRMLVMRCMLRCRRCRQPLCAQRDVFTASRSGAMGVYANPAGWLHQTLTVCKLVAAPVLDDAPPSTDSSWFRGYAWTIAYCQCGSHLGWRFTRVAASVKAHRGDVDGRESFWVRALTPHPTHTNTHTLPCVVHHTCFTSARPVLRVWSVVAVLLTTVRCGGGALCAGLAC
jgi:hypothetical protein